MLKLGTINTCREINLSFNGMWRSLVAHFVRDEGAVGSNPAIPIL